MLIILARQGEHIRESEKLALATRLMLIVQPSVPRVVVIARHPVGVRITIEQMIVRRIHLGCASALYIQFIEIAAQRG